MQPIDIELEMEHYTELRSEACIEAGMPTSTTKTVVVA
jgi:hypothetical protein